jgi:hypothetical protein
MGIGALLNEGVKYKKERRKILGSEAMSWLYLTSRRRWK